MITYFLRRALAAGLLSLGLFGTAEAQLITQTIGTGDSASYLILEADDFDVPLIYEYRYTYNSESPFDSYSMMTLIDAAVTNLSFDFVNFGTAESPNYFLNSVTYLTFTLTNTPYPEVGPYWAQWVAGGESGYPSAEPVPSNSWTYGSGISTPYRIIQPGSSDGFVFEADMSEPTVAPIPEPRAIFLLGMGGLGLGIWVVRKRREKARV